ncbi:MAG: ferrous iron transport protein A [bacterium]|nr:ferrous iron transport protein A [bacterium]
MTIPLSSISEGLKAKLQIINGGRQLRTRLAALGLLPGTEVEVIQNSGKGPFVLSVRGSRIVIGRGMASQVEVEQA